mgnify:CR=1 FL=1
MKLADIGIEPTRENVDLLAQRTINTNGNVRRGSQAAV